jgi:hypothetical protein
MSNKMNDEQLLAEIEDLSRTMPAIEKLDHETGENFAWLGRLAAFVEAWSLPKTMLLSGAMRDLQHGLSDVRSSGLRAIQILMYQAKHDLRMKTSGPLNTAIGHGLVFDYFDGVRKLLEPAREDLFFIDRYIDAEFVSRYLPHVAPGVSIRLLARDRITTLRPAVETFVQQFRSAVQIRSAATFHDRYMIVDHRACYQSGASFKDGAKSAPTTLTQITDAFEAVTQTYEAIWKIAKVEY